MKTSTKYTIDLVVIAWCFFMWAIYHADHNAGWEYISLALVVWNLTILTLTWMKDTKIDREAEN